MKTPIAHDARPGLDALPYRVGAYGDFRDSMLARLSDRKPPFSPLNGLTSRSPDDPTIALVEAFAMVCDVLTFYQERLANEGFLRTAQEPRSLEELARLTGYRLRPGVASSVFLAFTLDPNSAVTLPAGSRSQSVPGPGQIPQTFETSDDVAASGVWNAMLPRQTQPTAIPPGDPAKAASDLEKITVQGATTGLKPNDPLLVVVDGTPVLRRVKTLNADFDRKQTVIELQPSNSTAAGAPQGLAAGSTSANASPPVDAARARPLSPQAQFLQNAAHFATLSRIAPAMLPPNAQTLSQSPAKGFAPNAEASLVLASGLTANQQAAVFRSLSLTPIGPQPRLEVHTFRTSTAPFGNRAPPPMRVDANGRILPAQEWRLSSPVFGPEVLFSVEIGADLRGNGVTSVITIGEETLRLTVSTNATSASGSLPSVARITATLSRVDGAPQPNIELTYTFDDPLLLTFSVAVQGTDRPTTRIVRQQPDAQVTVEVGRERTVEEQFLHVLGSVAPVVGTQPTETPDVLYLDGAFETITPGTWVAFDAPPQQGSTLAAPTTVIGANTVSRVAYGQTARCSRLQLAGQWLNPDTGSFDRDVRQTTVYADSAPLTLTDEDIATAVSQPAGQPPALELDRLITGLSPGRWLIVQGERDDMPGVTASEVVLLAAIAHGEAANSAADATVATNDAPRTTLTFANPLAYSYKRDTVRVYGNVAAATQGESCDEILGSGDGSSANQTFTLKKPPVTQLPALTPSGSASTLRIFVNNIEWQEVDSLTFEKPDARSFVTSTAANGAVTVCFGDGVHGARLPSGVENVRARYRSGLGQSGNLDAGTITSLLSKPLGVNSVTNPVPASGGANAEDADAARRNIPLGLVSLARLVAVQDYHDFVLAFAGIGKADARRFSGPDGPLLHLTIAGAAGAALDASSALWQALDGSLRKFGDPGLEVEIASPVVKLAVIMADVAVEADRQWVDVEPVAREALYEKFGFAQRDIGQSLDACEVVAALQMVPGVLYVDLRLLVGAPQPIDIDQLRASVEAGGVEDIVANVARVDPGSGPPRTLLPGDLVYLSDILPEMLMLNEVKP